MSTEATGEELVTKTYFDARLDARLRARHSRYAPAPNIEALTMQIIATAFDITHSRLESTERLSRDICDNPGPREQRAALVSAIAYAVEDLLAGLQISKQYFHSIEVKIQQT